MKFVNAIKTAVMERVRSMGRGTASALLSLVMFLVVRRIFPWPFRQIGMRLMHKYGPRVLKTVRPYAERGVDRVTGIVQQVRGHESRPAMMESMPEVQRPMR